MLCWSCLIWIASNYFQIHNVVSTTLISCLLHLFNLFNFVQLNTEKIGYFLEDLRYAIITHYHVEFRMYTIEEINKINFVHYFTRDVIRLSDSCLVSSSVCESVQVSDQS